MSNKAGTSHNKKKIRPEKCLCDQIQIISFHSHIDLAVLRLLILQTCFNLLFQSACLLFPGLIPIFYFRLPSHSLNFINKLNEIHNSVWSLTGLVLGTWFEAVCLLHTCICLCVILISMSVGQNKTVPPLKSASPGLSSLLLLSSCFAEYVVLFKSCIYAELTQSTSSTWNHSAESTQQMRSCSSPKLGRGLERGGLIQKHNGGGGLHR